MGWKTGRNEGRYSRKTKNKATWLDDNREYTKIDINWRWTGEDGKCAISENRKLKGEDSDHKQTKRPIVKILHNDLMSECHEPLTAMADCCNDRGARWYSSVNSLTRLELKIVLSAAVQSPADTPVNTGKLYIISDNVVFGISCVLLSLANTKQAKVALVHARTCAPNASTVWQHGASSEGAHASTHARTPSASNVHQGARRNAPQWRLCMFYI